jgi:formylglycine-generating enzyme required for sulfatase activity
MEFMRIPAGKFTMGNDNGEINEKPQHAVDILYDFWMARYPVTNELYNAYLKFYGIKHPVDNWENKKDHPVVYARCLDAESHCYWLKTLFKDELSSSLFLRLPTEAEWEKASRGTDGREYPWGNTFDKSRFNSHESEKGDTTPVGIYSSYGVSPYGCVDMAGNVWEWTHTLNVDYPYNVDIRERINAIGYRVVRGGSFQLPKWNARCSSRRSYDMSIKNVDIGFRVCLTPLPLR